MLLGSGGASSHTDILGVLPTGDILLVQAACFPGDTKQSARGLAGISASLGGFFQDQMP